VPIEVPDTRAFAEPPVRRRRAAAAPAEPLVPAAEAAPASAFGKPPRRRRATDAVPEPAAGADPAAVEPVAVEPEAVPSSAFSRPVRRRPKAEASPVPAKRTAPAPAAAEPALAEPVVAEPVVAAVLEERRGVEGVVEAQVQVTDTVVVRLAGTRYAVEMGAVAEVGRPPHVTRVPGVPSWIAGVANWRGRVLPVLDLRVLLGAPSPELGVTGRILVLARDGVTLSFLAERVEGVVSLELDGLEPVLATLPRTTASVLSGQLTHPDGPIALLDLDVVFALRSQLPRVRRAG
jgi:purine-binding chemotaxis protein CheW